MYIIDETYFIKKISIANVNHNADAKEDLELSIDRYARLFLQMTLGSVLFEELDSYITDGELSTLAPQKWLNLVNGCTYDTDKVWKGFKIEDGLYKSSILAEFVYVNHYQNSVNTSLGQIAIEPKNGVNINSTSHLVDIWNDFINMYQGSTSHNAKSYFNNDVLFTDYYNGSSSNYVNYLQFLLDNKEDYPTISADYLAYKNSLGI